MRKITLGCLAAALLFEPGVILAQQQTSPRTSPTPSNPTKNNPDVPQQKPDTSNPDMAPQNQPAPGGTAGTSKKKSTNRKKRKNSSSTTSTTG
jgi:hypothetical protein